MSKRKGDVSFGSLSSREPIRRGGLAAGVERTTVVTAWPEDRGYGSVAESLLAPST